jgi:hypothetical protein
LGFKSPDYTQLVSTLSGETDANKRKQDIAQLNDFLLDQSFDMPVTENPLIMLATRGVTGVTPTSGKAMFLFTDTSLAS